MPRVAWIGVAFAVVGLLLLNGVPGGSPLGNALVLASALAAALQIAAMERFRAALRPAGADVPADDDGFVGLPGDRGRARSSSRCRVAGPYGERCSSPGVFAGALGYLVATWVQARTTAARAALVFTLEAPFAALFGVLLPARCSARSAWPAAP